MIQLDKTRIAIRERDYADILDLALRVVRGHAVPLLLASVAGMLPLIALNAWLLWSMAEPLAAEGFWVSGENWYMLRFLYWLGMLIVVETPLATAGITLLLGQIMFADKPDARLMVRDLAGSLPQLFVLQVALRAMLAPWVVTWLPLYTLWPYLNEIVLLERNPMFRRRGAANTLRRTWGLQSRNGNELFVRWLVSVLLGALLVSSAWMAAYSLRGMLFGTWRLDTWAYVVLLQLAIWGWIGFFSVVRFLSYLDLRIRNEGWEIELRMRAEAARLAGQLT